MAHPGDEISHLVTGDLTALARLRSLRNLDLDLLGLAQVARRHAEPPRGDLLDLGVRPVRSWLVVPVRVLAALAGIGPRSKPVHADRQRAMGFRTERAQRHGGDNESLDDVGPGFDLVDRDLRPRRLELEQITHGRGWLLLDLVEIGVEVDRVVRVTRRLDRLGDDRRVAVILALLLVLDQAVIRKPLGRSGVRLGVAVDQILLDLSEADPAQPGHRAGEGTVDDVLPEADHLEHLGAAIAGSGRDAHLRGDLQETVLQRRKVVLSELRRGERLVTARPGQRGGGPERQPRMHSRDAVPDQHAELMHVPDLAGVGDQVGAGTQPGGDQAMMHRATGQRHRYCEVVSVDTAIAQHQHARAIAHCRLGFGDDPVKLALERSIMSASIGGEHGRNRRNFQRAVVPDRVQGRLIQDQALEVNQASLLRRLRQQVATRSDEGIERHDLLLAERVDGGIGHLGEPLPEVGGQWSRPFRQHRQRRVVAHRPGGFPGLARHGRNNQADILGGIAERLL